MQHHLTKEQYQTLYQQSINQPHQFWAEQANKFVSWYKPWHTVQSGDFNDCNIRWFDGAELNVCYNCIDRHLPERANQTAIIWESDEPTQDKKITYQQLHENVCRFANVLKKRGVNKGDRVCIYMPMIPEAAYAMLACARIGAVHSVVFAGFSPVALKSRILDAECSVVITANEGIRGGKNIPLKNNVDTALSNCPNVHTAIVIKRTDSETPWHRERDVWYHEICQQVTNDCPAEHMTAEDPLFILYTSGSTGKPKGVLHTSAGYLVYAALSFHYVFDYHEKEIYWCTADVGWVTGHSYIVYGPLANGATTLLFEGTPSYPNASRFWEVIDKHQVNIFYTAPTAIRALMREGDEFVKSTKRKSLRLLGTVGEPINPEAWEWYFQIIGGQRCPVVDTWWQTETGGIMLTPIPYATELKPGAASWPFFGIKPEIVDDNGKVITDTQAGHLVITQPWPGIMRTVYGDHERFKKTYFQHYPGKYDTDDGAHRDKDGDFWVIGRMDDVINVSGHRIGTAEVESAIVESHDIAEAAVVGIPHEVKGQAIYAFVTPKAHVEANEELKQQIMEKVRQVIGSFARPEYLQWAPALPKTRSGKIMRRILRKIACGDINSLGDTSTLANPEVIEELLAQRNKVA